MSDEQGGAAGGERYNGRMVRDWQHEALTAYLREHAGEGELCYRSVHLTNPRQERRLDAIIAEEYWPQVCEAVRASRWTVRVDVDGTAPLQSIHSVNGHRYAARELTFMLVDVARWPPQRTGLRSAWHCEGALRVTAEQEIMYSWRFLLAIPETEVKVTSLIPALQEPLLAGNPPELHYEAERGYAPCGHWILSFSGGSGLSGFLGVHGSQQARDLVRGLTDKNLRAVDAAHELTGNFGDPALLAEAVGALTVAYEAW